jgi:hypothetical protein
MAGHRRLTCRSLQHGDLDLDLDLDLTGAGADASPLASVLSAGCRITYGHPSREAVERPLPFAEPVPAHAFQDRRASEASGPRYVVHDDPTMTRAAYATTAGRVIVVKSMGKGFSTIFGN